MIAIEPTRASSDLTAFFAEPAFDLWRDPNSLAAVTYRALAPFGLQLDGMKWDWGNSIGANRLNATLFDYLGVFDVRRDGIRLQFLNLPSNRLDEFGRSVEALLGAFSGPETGLAYKRYSFAVALDCKLSMEAKSFLSGFLTRQPEGLGKARGSGFFFSLEPSEELLSLLLFLESSVTIPGGLWVKVQGDLDATKVAPAGIRERVESLCNKSLASVGLELKTANDSA